MTRSTPLFFNVTRREPALLRPAKPTPRELKPLSDLDDQMTLRFHVPVALFYPAGGDRKRDPVEVIRKALGEALVYYYPWAGRLREGPGGKLMVDCTGEGVMFVEAEADVGFEELCLGAEGGFLQPPFPCFDKLLFDVLGSSGIVHCPVLLIPVTRLNYGGFVFAIRLNHTTMDAPGVMQFLNAIEELARGASQPSMLPVWSRELLLSRDPLRVSCTHREHEQLEGTPFPLHYEGDKIIERSFFFGPDEVSCLRQHLQPRLKQCTTFEFLAGFLWWCRTIALRFNPHEQVRYFSLVNARSKLNRHLPVGYYGNVFVCPTTVLTSGELLGKGLDYAVELVKKAKEDVTEEYVRSVTDLMATRGRPMLTVSGSWLVSDNTRVRFLNVDFGFGKPIYDGPASALVGAVAGPIGFFVKGVNRKGESGSIILICLPASPMERFALEVNSVVGKASPKKRFALEVNNVVGRASYSKL